MPAIALPLVNLEAGEFFLLYIGEGIGDGSSVPSVISCFYSSEVYWFSTTMAWFIVFGLTRKVLVEIGKFGAWGCLPSTGSPAWPV